MIDPELPCWVWSVLSICAGFLSAAIPLFFKLRVDFIELTGEIKYLSKQFHELSNDVDELFPGIKKLIELELYKAGNEVEERLAKFVDDDHLAMRKCLFETKKVRVFDFVQAWRFLLEDLFGGEPSVLRDVTFSSHGDASVRWYDFAAYPALVGRFVENDIDQKHKVKFLMVCNPNNEGGGNNGLAELFLTKLLQLRYPYCAQRSQLFNKWRDGDPGEMSNVQIMITNENIIKKATTSDFESPFNVYGDKVASRSFVKAHGASDKWVPHLEVLISSADVHSLSKSFDSVWAASERFRKRVLSDLTEEQKNTFGAGEVFHRWSSLNL